MGRDRHDTLAPVDHPAGARELAGGSSVSLVGNPSSAKVVAVNDGGSGLSRIYPGTPLRV